MAFGGCSNDDEMIGKIMMKNYFDEKNDDKKLDKGDCPTLRIIYI